MKTILVLTDFSIRADHAAHYSLKLAQKIKANLLLCNVYPAPSPGPVANRTVWPSKSPDTFARDSMDDLNELADRLNKHLDQTVAQGAFKPGIEQCSKAGSISNAVNEIAAKHHILMAVVSMHYAGAFSAFLAEDHTSEIIEKSDIPVLVVPNQGLFKGFSKIAFATDMTHNGIDILHCLQGLTKYFDSEIVITYVADEKLSGNARHQNIQNFFNLVTAKLNYPKLHYRAINSKSVTNGLDWMAEHTDIDLLVLVHRKRNFFQRLFEESVTQKMADHLIKPMLVFPGSKMHDTLPIF